MWIRVVDQAKNVQWVNGDHVVRVRQSQGVESRWTEIHFVGGSWITVVEEADLLVGRLM